MLTQRGLRTGILIFTAWMLINAVFGWHDLQPFIVSGLVMLFGLFISVTPLRVPEQARGAYASNRAINELKEFLQGNESCAYALYYASKLPPNDLMKFVRLVVETRYEFDQDVVEYVAKVVRGETNAK